MARIIANFILFLNLTGDEALAPDMAVQMMEDLANDLQALDKGFLRELVDAFPVIAPEYSGEAQQLVFNISRGFHLEEALASDDPVKLAELEARREAED
ncbi:hypothetical protein H5V43_09765 [Sphingobium fuliginis]|uniref:Uncharacterized protein n=1 Tax=Sphingobium fuliginis (strain ATCC 27551) TaxID=336203 RepID=A0A7M2GKD6_SPHSA|nr:hypothetical protein H5V43_09765 [Sphingobium fuliginis]